MCLQSGFYVTSTLNLTIVQVDWVSPLFFLESQRLSRAEAQDADAVLKSRDAQRS